MSVSSVIWLISLFFDLRQQRKMAVIRFFLQTVHIHVSKVVRLWLWMFLLNFVQYGRILSVKSQQTINDPADIITNKWPVHPAKTQISLGIHPVWSVFAARSVGSLRPIASSCGQRRLISLGRCPGLSESSQDAQVILLVLLCACSFWKIFISFT